MELKDIYRTCHPRATECTFFSNPHGTFSRINHMFNYKTIFNKFMKIEIVSSSFSNHHGMKLEIKYKKKNGKFTNM